MTRDSRLRATSLLVRLAPLVCLISADSLNEDVGGDEPTKSDGHDLIAGSTSSLTDPPGSRISLPVALHDQQPDITPAPMADTAMPVQQPGAGPVVDLSAGLPEPKDS
jgi:hypothetical protein